MPMKPEKSERKAPKRKQDPGQQPGALTPEGEEEEREHGDRVDREHLVLAHQEGHRALPDVARDHVHRVRAFWQALDTEIEEHRDYQADHAGRQGNHRQLSDQITHRRFHPLGLLVVFGATALGPPACLRSGPEAAESWIARSGQVRIWPSMRIRLVQSFGFTGPRPFMLDRAGFSIGPDETRGSRRAASTISRPKPSRGRGGAHSETDGALELNDPGQLVSHSRGLGQPIRPDFSGRCIAPR